MHQGQASQPGGSEEFLARFQRALHKNEIWRCAMALLSQEGSTIETAVEIVRGVVPGPHSLRIHSETFGLGYHPSRHRKERDDAALLTQEGNSPAFTVAIILCVESILDSRAPEGGINKPGGPRRRCCQMSGVRCPMDLFR